ncbi:MAG: hypothetical protein ACYTGH_21555, partial [Planctomycetota bacterium]
MKTTPEGRGSRLDGRFLTVFALILLFGPYLPVPGLEGKPLRLDHLLLPITALTYLILGIRRGELSLASPLWQYGLFIGCLLFSTVIQDPHAEGLAGGITLLAGIESYLRPGLLLFIAFNLRLTPKEYFRYLRLVLLAAIPLCLLGVLQGIPATGEAVNRLLFALYHNGFPSSFAQYHEQLDGHALSVFGQIPTFAMFCLFGLALVVSHVLGSGVARSRPLTWITLLLLVAGGVASGDQLFAGGAILFLLLLLLL